MVETQKRLLSPINEFEDVGNIEMAKLLCKAIKNSILAIESDLKSVEAKITDTVNADANLRKLYKIIASVIGIGFVTPVNLIIHTNQFRILNDTRKLACY